MTAADEQAWNREALVAPVEAPRVGIWHYADAAVVLGCSQTLHDQYPSALPIIKRAAGGGAVLVGPWLLSLSVVLPIQHPLAAIGLMESYRWLGELIAGELRYIGISATALAPSDLSAQERDLNWACFGGLSPWEVVVRGRKIAGLAQRHCRNGVLLAAGILVSRSNWPLLCAAMGRDVAAAELLKARTISCAEALGRRISRFDLGALLGLALREALFPTQHRETSPLPILADAAMPRVGYGGKTNPWGSAKALP